MSNTTQINLTAPVTTDGMGDGWDDYEQAAHSYAEWLQTELHEHLRNQYPEAKVFVCCPVLNQAGGGEEILIVENDEDGYPGDMLEDIRNFSQDCWGRWCSMQPMKAGKL